jgi:hypothetical protein
LCKYLKNPEQLWYFQATVLITLNVGQETEAAAAHEPIAPAGD